MGAPDITTTGMLFSSAAAIISLIILTLFKVNLKKEVLVTFIRMTVQLLLVGLYLEVMFNLNSPVINSLYIIVMIVAADYTILRSSGFNSSLFFYTLPAYLISIVSVLLFYTVFVFRPENFFDARYIIPVAGMLLGNSMTRTVVTLERFYSSIKRENDTYLSYLSMGATTKEAAIPFFKRAYKAGMAPSLANYAAIGLISLPGMMTGQILGGSDPMIAVKYQLAIIFAIFAATEISTVLALIFSMKKGLKSNGMLNNGIFKG